MLTKTEGLLDNAKKQLEISKEQLEKPFAKEDELKQKEARLAELNALLNVDKRENEIVDEAPDEGNSTPARSDVDRDDR